MANQRADEQTRALLASRLRATAFAAAGAGLTREELHALVEVAYVAEQRRLAAEARVPRQRHLFVVRDTSSPPLRPV